MIVVRVLQGASHPPWVLLLTQVVLYRKHSPNKLKQIDTLMVRPPPSRPYKNARSECVPHTSLP